MHEGTRTFKKFLAVAKKPTECVGMASIFTTIFSTLGTIAGICLVLPQILKMRRNRTAAGVSLGGLVASFFSWYLWVPYPMADGDLRGVLGLAVPGAIQGVAVYYAWRYKASRGDMITPVLMLAVVGGAFAIGGWALYMTALGTTTIWAYAPSLVSAIRSADISGISTGAWWVTVGYGFSWLAFGLLSQAGGFIYTGSMNAGLSLLVLGALYMRRDRRPVSVLSIRSNETAVVEPALATAGAR